jgi:hypothetical protein
MASGWSKTDQAVQGQFIAMLGGAYMRPVEALQGWLQAGGSCPLPRWLGWSSSARAAIAIARRRMMPFLARL